MRASATAVAVVTWRVRASCSYTAEGVSLTDVPNAAATGNVITNAIAVSTRSAASTR
jgi:hypothetical protein